MSWTRVSRVEGSVRTRGQIGTEAKRERKEKKRKRRKNKKENSEFMTTVEMTCPQKVTLTLLRNSWTSATNHITTVCPNHFLQPILNCLWYHPMSPPKRSTLPLATSNAHPLLGMSSMISSNLHKKTLRHVICWNGGLVALPSFWTCQNLLGIYLVH